jgi:hypothetical protein
MCTITPLNSPRSTVPGRGMGPLLVDGERCIAVRRPAPGVPSMSSQIDAPGRGSRPGESQALGASKSGAHSSFGRSTDLPVIGVD